jgi:ribonuclease Z
MEIIFLGTSCMYPTKTRNHPGVLVLYKGEGLLFDCGEGIQRQLKVAGIKPTVVTKIFISHWHGDHVLGLPGLVQTASSIEGTQPIQVYGPHGTKKNVAALKKIFGNDSVNCDAHDVKKGRIVNERGYVIETAEMKHTAPCVGYVFIEKDRRKMNLRKVKKMMIPTGPLLGKLQRGEKIKHNGKTIKPDEVSVVVPGRRIAYATDTRPCNGIIRLGKDADVLILESTYKSDLADKAKEYKHLTAKEAASLANEARAKRLFLLHFSPRYKNGQELEEDARDIFDNTEAAEDFMRIKL